MPDADLTVTNSPLDRVLGEYLQAVEAGQVPSRQALFDAHPDLADALRDFFAGFDRLDRRADAIRLRLPDRPACGTSARYELIEEVARGAMGVVYKARQASLDRVVALEDDPNRGAGDGRAEVPLPHGGRGGRGARPPEHRADPRDRRTRRPAVLHDEVRRRRHPGAACRAARPPRRPSGSRRWRGPSISHTSAASTPRPGSRRTWLCDRDGTLLVADFGLAKRVDADRSLTATGSPVGTPKYMAPEQAAGQRGVTTAADVYGLGVMLYERLTGRVPFVADHWAELFRLIQHAEPPRPTELVPTLPRDLETVCLKSLRKEPAQRYATAGELADDLARWRRGEPISARPVGRLERAWLWCRRNPAVAGLTAGVAASLVGGIAVSSYYAVAANRQTVLAGQARDDAERNLVRSFLRPIGYTSYQAEWHSFNELSQLDNDRLRLMCLREALATPDAATCFARRSEEIVQAVVGVSERRRQQALALATQVQRDEAASPQSRLAACCLALRLGGTDLPAADWSAQWAGTSLDFTVDIEQLSAAQAELLWPAWMWLLESGDDAMAVGWASECVTVIAGRLDPATDRERLRRATDALIAVLGRATREDVTRLACNGLPSLTDRLDAVSDGERLRRAADALLGLLSKHSDDIIGSATRGLARLADRLDSTADRRRLELAANVLTAKVLAKASGGDITAIRAAYGLKNLADRLDPSQAAACADYLIDGLSKAPDSNSFTAACHSLGALVDRLDPTARRRRLDRTVDVFIGVLRRSTNLTATSLTTFAHWLDPAMGRERLGRTADALIDALGKGTDVYSVSEVGSTLATLAAYLDSAAAASRTDALVGLLVESIGPAESDATAVALAALAGRLDPASERERLDRAVDTLIAALGKFAKEAGVVRWAGSALAPLTYRLEPTSLAARTDALIGVAGKATDGTAIAAAVIGLSSLAGGLDPASERERLGRAADALIDVLGQTTDVVALEAAGDGMPRLADLLNPAMKRERLSRAADALIGVLGKTTARGTLFAASDGLSAVAGHLDPAAAASRADTLTGLLGKATNADAEAAAVCSLAAWPAGSTRRPSRERLCRVADALIDALDKSTDSTAIREARDGLTTLAGRLDAADARRIWHRATAVVVARQGRDRTLVQYNDWQSVLAAMVPALPTELADRFCQSLISQYGNAERSYKTARMLVDGLHRIDTVATCLCDHRCTGQVQAATIQRLEQLAFQPTAADRQRLVAEVIATGLVEPASLGVLAAGRQAAFERQRRFRTVWDAVAWLRQHRPDIDLDSPYRPPQR
ncbi:MAG: protein kinase [Gemmataceae bacterium]